MTIPEKVSLIKEFLESIPQFINDLEPGNDYLKVPGVSDPNIYKMLKNYSYEISDQGYAYSVYGFLAVPLTDLITLPGWHVFKSKYPDVSDIDLYYKYLEEVPHFGGDFDLEQFVDTFRDFYLDFLIDSGLTEDDVDISGNIIKVWTEEFGLSFNGIDELDPVEM